MIFAALCTIALVLGGLHYCFVVAWASYPHAQVIEFIGLFAMIMLLVALRRESNLP